MPRETYRDVHADRPLTNISAAYFQDQSVFVSGKLFPIVNVSKASDTFDVYPQGYWNRIYESARGEESVANSITYKVTKDKYAVGDDALRIFISDKKRANTDSQRRLDMEATQIVTQALALAKENDFAAKYMGQTSWTTAYQGSGSAVTGTTAITKWSDDSSEPIAQIKEACKAVYLASAGRKANRMIVTYDVWITLTEHPDLVERVKYMGTNDRPGEVTKKAVASLFEMDEIMVMSSIANTADAQVEDSTSGLPAVKNEFLQTGTVLLGHVPKNVGLMTPCSGITFTWSDYVRPSAMAGPTIRRYRPMDGRKGEYIEAELAIDQKLVSKDMAAIFTSVI